MALRELAPPRASADDAERPAVVVASDLVRRFGEVEAVRGVSFAVGEGEIFGFLGPNGGVKQKIGVLPALH